MMLLAAVVRIRMKNPIPPALRIVATVLRFEVKPLVRDRPRTGCRPGSPRRAAKSGLPPARAFVATGDLRGAVRIKQREETIGRLGGGRVTRAGEPRTADYRLEKLTDFANCWTLSEALASYLAAQLPAVGESLVAHPRLSRSRCF